MTQQKQKGMWKRTLSLIFKIRIPWALYIIQVVIGFISTNVSMAYIPYYTKMQTGRIDGLSTVAGYLGFSVLALVMRLLEHIPAFYASATVTRRMQNKLMRHALRMHMSAFERSASQLLSWITNDASLTTGLITTIIGFVTGMYAAYLSITSLSAINTSMLVILPVIVLYILFETWLEGKLLFLRGRRERRASAELTAYLSEHLSFFTQIRQMHTWQDELKLGKEADRQYFRATLYQAWITLAIDIIGVAISDIMTIIVFVMGVPMVNAGSMTITDLASFQNYVLMAYNAFSSFPGLYTGLMSYNGDLFYISSLLAEPEEDYRPLKSMDVEDQDIVLDHVSFQYGEKPVLQDVSLTIPKGKLTVLVGPNGSGKTTLFKLLERFYTPTSGSIRFGDYPAQDMNLQEWRQSFAYVLQDPQLFDASIRDNIAYGMDRAVSDEEIMSAARTAMADGFIAQLPGGLDFLIGENGCNLSAGQRQRIALARALMLDPAYLLLDEATCNMDHAGERQVTDAILKLMEGRTTVMISHNMEILERADHVVVLNQGRVEADGTREEAMAASETLRQLMLASA